MHSDPDWIQTNDLLLRRQLLYSTELPGRNIILSNHDLPEFDVRMVYSTKPRGLITWLGLPPNQGRKITKKQRGRQNKTGLITKKQAATAVFLPQASLPHAAAADLMIY